MLAQIYSVYLPKAAVILTAAVTVASAICSITGTPSPETKLGKAYKILEWLALNVGKAKDKGETK